MTKENKELLLNDLIARLPYSVKIHCGGVILGYLHHHYEKPVEEKDLYEIAKVSDEPVCYAINSRYDITEVKPYLRPMSDMTPEENAKYYDTQYHFINDYDDHTEYSYDTLATYDYLNSIHVDYRGLINKGLAIKVTKENNPYKK